MRPRGLQLESNSIWLYTQSSSGVRDVVSESISSTRLWERGDTEKLMSLLPHDDEVLHGEKIDGSARKRGVFLDVGANVG